MSLFGELKERGVNVEEGLERVMGDESLYEMMLGMFVGTVQDNPISPEDFDAENFETLIERVHLLKGFTGNLAMEPLFTRYTRVLAFLREGDAQTAREEFACIPVIQGAILDCIKQCSGD